MIAHDFLDHGLRCMPTGLGAPVVALRRETEGIFEVGDPAAVQRLAEGERVFGQAAQKIPTAGHHE